MKKRFAYVLTGVLMAFMLTACGNNAETTGADPENVTVQDEDAKEAKEIYLSNPEQKNTDYEVGDGESYEETYKLEILDDSRATFYDITKYDDVYTSINAYTGSYKKTEQQIVFSYEQYGEETKYVLDINGTEITAVHYDLPGSQVGDIAGSYTGKTEEFGDVTIEIAEDGSAVLKQEDGIEVNGDIFLYDEKWDFTASYEAGEAIEYIDWLIDFEGSTFTYVPYSEYLYKDYAGTYTYFGDLGEITVVVNEDGTATTTVEIEGQAYDMTGSVYVDSDLGQITSCSFDCDKYSMYIDIVQLSDGTWNYSGSLSTSLNAG